MYRYETKPLQVTRVLHAARRDLQNIFVSTELDRRGLVEELLGLNCAPVAITGTKLRLLRILSIGLKRHSISMP